ncbi:MAG: signal peptidase I [Oscillospiraceae bacterium]|nr:signal peptidase I [Oscillospiraceae bacterium]
MGRIKIFSKKDVYSDEEQHSGGVVREAFDIVETAVVSLVTVIMVFTFLFRVVGIEGTSMIETLHEKDIVLVSDFLFEPKFGDIVVLNLPSNFSKPIIKRIIGLPGDTIDIDDSEGIIYVNGKELDEPYTTSPTYRKSHSIDYPLVVGEDMVYVLGDNRNGSTDSRSIDCIDKNAILGKAFFRVFPFNDIGRIG